MTATDTVNPFGAIKAGLVLVLALSLMSNLTGCSQLIASSMSGMTESVTKAVVNHDDPELVESGIPAYMLILDGAIQDDPRNGVLLERAANLYTVYADAYADRPERRKKLIRRAFDYGLRAVCSTDQRYCSIRKLTFDAFAQLVADVPEADLSAWFALGAAWANWIRVNQEDVSAVAELPRVQLIMEQIVAQKDSFQNGSAHLYLGVLATILPPALGGRPEVGKAHFQRAIHLSQNRNLMAKVLYAQYYARMLYNRSMHDRLLKDVLAADPYRDGFTLSNIMAQDKARRLLDGADDYF